MVFAVTRAYQKRKHVEPLKDLICFLALLLKSNNPCNFFQVAKKEQQLIGALAIFYTKEYLLLLKI